MSRIDLTDFAPRVIVFAGPNGAGKTSHATAILDTLDVQIFVNADWIARGLVGHHTKLAAFAAGRIMLRQLRELAVAGVDFAFESTLASRTFAKFLADCRKRGYRIAIFFFSLESPDLAVARVARRVAMGGHGIPEDDIRRRFHRSREYFLTLYKPLADEFTVLDNSTDDAAVVVAQGSRGALTVVDSGKWHAFNRQKPSADRS